MASRLALFCCGWFFPFSFKFDLRGIWLVNENLSRVRDLRYRTSLIIWVLLLAACQPYPDHGEVVAHFYTDLVDFGARRELALVNSSGDRDGLLLEFNQPIAELGQQDVPFELSFQPHIPGAVTSMVGCASVRIDFPRPLALAHRYRANIPKGWRALTGASFVRPQIVEWETGRPKLLEVTEDDEEGGAYLFHLDQDVSPDSLRHSLQLFELGTEVHSPGEVQDVVNQGDGLYKIVFSGLSSQVSYDVGVLPGLKALSGPLEGSGGERFPLTGGVLKVSGLPDQVASSGCVSLKFSHPVEPAEILCHLKGVESNQVLLTSQDGCSYQVSWPDLATADHQQKLTLLAGLRSEDGHSLSEPLTISVLPPSQESVPRAVRMPERIGPEASVYRRRIKKGSRLATWSLTRKQAIRLTSVSESTWKAKQKMPEELAPPLYKMALTKDFAATRFLAKDASGQHSFLLVRIAEPTGAVRRLLLSRSSQIVNCWYVNSRVTAQVPKGSVTELLDRSGEVLSRGRADSQGQVSFQGPWEQPPGFLSSRLGGNTVVQELEAVQVRPPDHTPAFLWSTDSIHGPVQEFSYFGVWLARGERDDLVLRDEQGEVRELDSHFVESLGPLFAGRFKTPEQPGAYSLDFRSTANTGAKLPFLVTGLPLQSLSEATLVLDELAESERMTGSYVWRGPGEVHLDLRARLRRRIQRRDGWRTSLKGQTNWLDVPIERQYGFLKTSFTLGPLPEVTGAWQLEVELVDKNCPDLVVARATHDIGDSPLVLVGAQAKELSLQDRLTKFRFEFSDRLEDRPLRLQLYRESEQVWALEEQGEAEWRDGAFEWGVGLFQSGRYRLECLWEDEEGVPHSLSFEKRVSTDQLDDIEPLVTHPADDSPFGVLEVAWPELEENSQVWVSVLNAEGLVSSELFSSAQQQVGSVARPIPHLGEKEQILLAGLQNPGRSGFQLRALRIPVNSGFALKEPLLTAEERSELQELEPKAESRLQLPLSEWAKTELQSCLVWWRPASQSSSLSPGALPEQVSPLHSDITDRVGLPFLGPLEIKQRQFLEIDTPGQGQFELCILGLTSEGDFSFQVQPLEVAPRARWEPLIPPVFRPKDQFLAGLRFWSDPEELTPTGITSSVSLDSTLLPQTYFSTANLIDPASQGDMLFSYRSPDFLAASQSQDFRLEWELGVEGEAIPVGARLTCLPTLTEDSLRRSTSVNRQRAFRFNLTSLKFWKLKLQLEEKASLEPECVIRISGLGDKVEEVELDQQNPSFEFFGQDDTVLDVRLAQGPEVRLELYQLEPKKEEQTLKGLELYLLRRLVSSDGEAVKLDKLSMDSDYSAEHHLVLPVDKGGLFLDAPIPGGTRASGCWLVKDEALIPLSWIAHRGGVRVEIPDLVAGEHVVKVGLQSVVPGRFGWPGARVVDTEGQLQAQVPATQVGVEEP